MSKAWPRVRLGEVLEPVQRPEPVEPTQKYRLVGVRLDGQGPFLRETVLGAQTAANKLYRLAAGDFIYSRLFAWRGAFGIVPGDLDGCYASGEFPTFRPALDRLDLRFLCHWFRLPDTLRRVEEDCSGSTPLTRNRFKEKFFLALEVPLPPLHEQQRIVARIEELVGTLDRARTLRHQTLQEIECLSTSARAALIGSTPAADWVPLSAYLRAIESGKSPSTEGRPAEPHEWGVLKVGAVSFGSFDDRENKALPTSFAPIPKLEVRPGDFLMSRANTATLVGACAVVRETRPRLMLSDKTFRFVFRDRKAVDVRFLEHVLKSPALRDQIVRAATGTSPTMKNISKEKVLALRVPAPPLEDQRHIAAELDRLELRAEQVRKLHSRTAAELDALLPSILDRAFNGDL